MGIKMTLVHDNYFFALVPEKSMAKNILNHSCEAVDLSYVNWTPLEKIHLTLAYLGHPEQAIMEQLPALAAAIPFAEFDLHLTTLHYIRRRGMLWLRPASTPKELKALVDSLWQALKPFHLVPDHPDFIPHMTLARHLKKFQQPKPFEPLLWHNGSFSLLKSQSSEKGVIYQEICRFS